MIVTTIKSAIKDMEPGGSLEIPFEQVARRTVGYYVSRMSKLLGREYHMRTIKSRNSYMIFREA